MWIYDTVGCCESVGLRTVGLYMGKAHKNCIIGKILCLRHIIGTTFITRMTLYVNNCRGHQDESEYIYFYIVYVSHLSSIDEYCRTFGSNTVILACLQTHIAHSILLHKKSINCNQTIYNSIRKLSYCNCFLSAFVCLKDMFP